MISWETIAGLGVAIAKWARGFLTVRAERDHAREQHLASETKATQLAKENEVLVEKNAVLFQKNEVLRNQAAALATEKKALEATIEEQELRAAELEASLDRLEQAAKQPAIHERPLSPELQRVLELIGNYSRDRDTLCLLLEFLKTEAHRQVFGEAPPAQ